MAFEYLWKIVILKEIPHESRTVLPLDQPKVRAVL